MAKRGKTILLHYIVRFKSWRKNNKPIPIGANCINCNNVFNMQEII
ncbi:hypothetical protein MOMOMA043M_18600 [Morganella morganii]